MNIGDKLFIKACQNGGPEHAAAVENFYRLMFSLEMVEGIMMWGFWDQVEYKKKKSAVY